MRSCLVQEDKDVIVELSMAGYAPLPCHHVNEANIVELAIKKEKSLHYHKLCINCVTCTKHMYDIIFFLCSRRY